MSCYHLKIPLTKRPIRLKQSGHRAVVIAERMKKHTITLLAYLFVLVGCSLMSPEKKLTQCVNAENPLPLDEALRLPGTFIYNNNQKIIAVDGRSHTEKLIIDLGTLNESRFVAGMTPNGEWFSYFTQSPMPEKKTTAHLLSSIGEAISVTLSIPPSGLPTSLYGYDWFPVYWVNNEVLLVAGGLAGGGERNVLLLNPFTEIWYQSLLDSLPDRYTSDGVAFSPDLTRVLYLAGTGSSERTLVLWDTEHQRGLWRGEPYLGLSPNFYNVPRLDPTAWSMDSSVVAFPLILRDKQTVRLYVISRDGDQIWLIRPDSPDNRSYGFSWSPDGSYLAFVAPLARDPEQSGIVIYNRTENTSTDMCPLVGGNPISRLETNGRLVWSPESRYLVFGMG
jgi:hypothetical protein